MGFTPRGCGRSKVQVTGHLSQAIVLPIQKVCQTLAKANLRPKNFCLGLFRPKVSFSSVWDTFCIGKTMTCDLYFSPAVEMRV